MPKAAATAGNLPLLLSLFFPLSCLGSSLPADATSLCYSFTVDKAESGECRQEVQGQLNEETFIYCNGTRNCHAIGDLGNRLSATESWEAQFEPLKDGLDVFKGQASQMNLGKNTIKEPLTLQTRMCCWHEVDGHFNGSWDFELNGHKMLHFHPSTGKWTEVDPGSSMLRQMWEKNRDVIGFLNRTSQGDCNSWLKNFKSHYEEKLEPQGHHTLQATMIFQYEQGQVISAFWQFNINGKSFLLNTMNRAHTPSSLKWGGIMNDDKFTERVKMSKEDSSHWLQELLKLQEEITRSSSTAPNITELTLASQLPPTINVTQSPPTTKSHSNEALISVGDISIIIIIAIVIVFLICMYVRRNSHTQGDRNQQLCMNCSINCHKAQRTEKPMELIREFPNKTTKLLSQEDEPKTQRPEESNGFPGTGLTDDCECSEVNSGDLQEQLITPELSLQPYNECLKNINA